jgi:hypothetical protein
MMDRAVVRAKCTTAQKRFTFTAYIYSPLLSLSVAKARFDDSEVGRFASQDSFPGSIDDPRACMVLLRQRQPDDVCGSGGALQLARAEWRRVR